MQNIKKKKSKIRGFYVVYVRVENQFSSVTSVKEHSFGQVWLGLTSLRLAWLGLQCAQSLRISGHFPQIRFCRMAIPPKINFTELNVPKDNFTEYPYEWKPICQIHIAAEWCKIWKLFTKKILSVRKLEKLKIILKWSWRTIKINYLLTKLIKFPNNFANFGANFKRIR